MATPLKRITGRQESSVTSILDAMVNRLHDPAVSELDALAMNMEMVENTKRKLQRWFKRSRTEFPEYLITYTGYRKTDPTSEDEEYTAIDTLNFIFQIYDVEGDLDEDQNPLLSDFESRWRKIKEYQGAAQVQEQNPTAGYAAGPIQNDDFVRYLQNNLEEDGEFHDMRDGEEGGDTNDELHAATHKPLVLTRTISRSPAIHSMVQLRQPIPSTIDTALSGVRQHHVQIAQTHQLQQQIQEKQRMVETLKLIQRTITERHLTPNPILTSTRSVDVRPRQHQLAYI